MTEELRREIHHHHHGHHEEPYQWQWSIFGFVLALVLAWACGALHLETKPQANYAVEQGQCGQDNPGQEVRCAMAIRGLRLGDYRATRQVVIVDPFGNWPSLTEAKTGWYKAILRQEHLRLLQAGDADGARRLREELNADWLFHNQPSVDGS